MKNVFVFCLFVLFILARAPVGGIIHCDRFRSPPVYLSELDYVERQPRPILNLSKNILCV